MRIEIFLSWSLRHGAVSRTDRGAEHFLLADLSCGLWLPYPEDLVRECENAKNGFPTFSKHLLDGFPSKSLELGRRSKFLERIICSLFLAGGNVATCLASE